MTAQHKFMIALIGLFFTNIGWAATFYLDRQDKAEAEARVERLRGDYNSCMATRTACETRLTVMHEDVERQKKQLADMRASDRREVDLFLKSYTEKIAYLKSARGSFDEPGSTERKESLKKDILTRAAVLVEFVKEWRLIVPYLCGLLNGEIDAISATAETGDADGVLRAADRAFQKIKDRGDKLRDLVEKARSQPLGQTPCICTNKT